LFAILFDGRFWQLEGRVKLHADAAAAVVVAPGTCRWPSIEVTAAVVDVLAVSVCDFVFAPSARQLGAAQVELSAGSSSHARGVLGTIGVGAIEVSWK